jgi:hypothetical protein
MLPAHSAESFAKLALYVALFILPGGCVILLVLWWLSGRRGSLRSIPRTFVPMRRVEAARSWAPSLPGETPGFAGGAAEV